MLKSEKLLHVFKGERLQAFSDAVFAIIATLMVIPLKLDREDVREGGVANFELEEFLLGQWSRYFVYAYSFSMVVDVWYNHVGIFTIVEQVDDVIIWLNLLCLMLVSFLPYSTGLVSSYPNSESYGTEHIAITICALNLMMIGIVMLLILLYSFRRQSLLHPEIENNKNFRFIRKVSIISVLMTPCLSLIAMCFSFITNVPSIAMFIFYCTGTASFLTRIILHAYFKYKKKLNDLPNHMIRAVANTFRTEAFSDGLFSIVATLIVLDLTTESIPDPDDVKNIYNGDLHRALYAQRFVFVSYITSFIVVGLMWFVHYSMMHFIENLTPLLSHINIITLFLVGGIPFVSGVTSIISDDSIHGEGDMADINIALSTRTFCVLVFLASTSQLIFWTVAIFQKKTCMSEGIDQLSHSLQFSKMMVFPTLSFISYWCTFSDTFIQYKVYNILLFSTPFIFLILKAVFKKNRSAMRKVECRLSNLITKNGRNEVNCLVEEKTSLVGEKGITTQLRVVDKGREQDIELANDNRD